MFEELCHYAGREKLATQVRPSRRRPGRTEVEEEVERSETVSNGEGAELKSGATGLYSEVVKRSSPTTSEARTSGAPQMSGTEENDGSRRKCLEEELQPLRSKQTNLEQGAEGHEESRSAT